MHFKQSIFIFISIGIALCTMSCQGFSGPSDQDVIDALDPVFNGFVSVPFFQDSMAEEFQYNDTVEMFNENEDRTITQNSTFSVDREESYLSTEGICKFDDFWDNRSGYTINGTIEYSIDGSLDKNSDDMNLELVFDLIYDGGNIESISFTLNDEFEHSNDLPEVIVNGKPFQFKEEAMYDVFRILKDMKVM